MDKKTEEIIIKKLRTAGCVFAENEARLLISEAQTLDKLTDMVEQRVTGLPLEHIIGWADFCGIRIEVEQGVFIPRPRTEFLVKQAAFLATPGSIIVDLCCGTGAVGAALAKVIGLIELYATDIDPTSVKCARQNTTFFWGNVYEGAFCRRIKRLFIFYGQVLSILHVEHSSYSGTVLWCSSCWVI
ncbi:methyltransferase [Bacillus megaterium]|nr:methyltransferase [Priestia megaterium]